MSVLYSALSPLNNIILMLNRMRCKCLDFCFRRPQINGHTVLQSSDKVVKTLLDARSLLEIVVARDNNNKQQQIAAATTSGFGATASAHHSNSDAYGGGAGGGGEAGNAARASSPPLVFHDMNDIVTNHRFQTPGSSSDVIINSGNLLSERSRRYDVSHVNNQNNATSSRTLNTTAAFSDVKTDDVMTVWDSEHALVSPRFQQLSEGATFML